MDASTSKGESNKKAAGKGVIDPLHLLECLHILLCEGGGIKNLQCVQRLVVLMGKYSKKLVSKCMYLNILLATDRSMLDLFYKHGGWRMVSEWLEEAAMKKGNWPLTQVILELLNVSPITLERLHENDMTMVKQVKFLTEVCPHQAVKSMANLLVLHWARMSKAAKLQTPPTTPTTTTTVTTTAASGLPTVNNNSVIISSVVNPSVIINPSVTPVVTSKDTTCDTSVPKNAITDTSVPKNAITTANVDGVSNNLPKERSNTNFGNGNSATTSNGNSATTITSIAKEVNTIDLEPMEVSSDDPTKVESTMSSMSTISALSPMKIAEVMPVEVEPPTEVADPKPKLSKLKIKLSLGKIKRASVSPPRSSASSGGTNSTLSSSNTQTAVIKQSYSILVTTPVPLTLIGHVTGRTTVQTARVGRGAAKRGAQLQVLSVVESSANGKIQSKPPIKITIRSGSQVLAKVTSQKDYVDRTISPDSKARKQALALNKQVLNKPFPSEEFISSAEEDDSDEDFVVEFNKKPLKALKSKLSKGKLKGSGSVNVKRKARMPVIIESDDSCDSLPMIDPTDAKFVKKTEANEVKTKIVRRIVMRVNEELSENEIKPETNSVASKKSEKSENQTCISPSKGSENSAIKPKLEKSDIKIEQEELEIKLKNISIDKIKKFSEKRSDSVSSDGSIDKKNNKMSVDDRKDVDKNRSSSSKKSNKEKNRERERSKYDKESSERDNDKNKKKDRDRDRDRNRERERKPSSSDKDRSGTSTSTSSSKDKERERRRERERRERREKEKSQYEKDKSTLEKVKPLSADGLSKIPRKPSSFLDALGSADPLESGEVEAKKPPIKVKSHGFRSTGLLDSTTNKNPGIAGKRTIPPSSTTSTSNPSLLGNKPTKQDADKYVQQRTNEGQETLAIQLPGFRPNKRPLDDASSVHDKRLRTTISSLPLSSDRPGGSKLISPKRRRDRPPAPAGVPAHSAV